MIRVSSSDPLAEVYVLAERVWVTTTVRHNRRVSKVGSAQKNMSSIVVMVVAAAIQGLIRASESEASERA